jgi:hypothetical protein
MVPAEGLVSLADEKDTLVQLFHAYAYDPARRLIYDLEIEPGYIWKPMQVLPAQDYLSR